YYLLRGTNFRGDVLILHALRDTGDDQHFLVGQAVLRARRGKHGRLRLVSFNDPANALVIEPHLSALDLADAADEQVRRNGAIDDAFDAAAQIVHGGHLVDIAGDDNDLHVRVLFQNLGDGFGRVRGETGFEEKNVGRELGDSGDGLAQVFGLGHDANVVFQRQNLANTDAENSLRVGDDQTQYRLLIRLRNGTTAVDWLLGRHRPLL